MDVIIKESYEEISRYGANILAVEIRNNPDINLGLATGNTWLGVYKELIRIHNEEELDFSKVTTFNLDEYYGIGIDFNKSPKEDQSYARFMHENFFRHVNINQENTHIPDGLVLLENLDDYCEGYENEIKSRGGIDLQILGIGKDGHIGFNEPASSVKSRTRLEILDETTIDTNWEKFYRKAGGKKEDMPYFAITMGIGTILESKRGILMASGEEKAEIIAKALEGPLTAQITASYLPIYHPSLTVLLDEAAASKLERYEHYKHVEELKRKFLK